MTTVEQKPAISVREAAHMLGVSPDVIRSLADRNKLKWVKYGGHLMIDRDSFDELSRTWISG